MYRKDSAKWIKHIDFIILDMICLQLAYVLSYALAGYGFNPYLLRIYRVMAFFLTAADVFLTFTCDTMSNVLKRGYYREFVITLGHSAMVILAGIVMLFLTQRGQVFSRMTMVFLVIVYTGISYGTRLLWKKLLYRKMEHGEGASMLVVATADIAEEALKNLQTHNYAQYKYTGLAVLDEDWQGKDVNHVPVVATSENLVDYVCQHWVDEVMIITSDSTPVPQEMIERLTETGVTVHYCLRKIAELSAKQQKVGKVGNYTVLTSSVNYMTTGQMFLKRTMDIFGGLVGCLLTGIIFIFVAPAIYRASPGPIFYSHKRVGRNGKEFKMYKFRSMYLDADARKAELMKQNRISDAKMFKIDFDPRIIGNKVLPDGTRKTGIGEFIRRTSLDEFPQFFNVLKGDMSLVGTRPPLPSETALYEPHHHVRLAVKPGITGMWQVSGRSNITNFEEVVRLDKEYIENWTIGLDIKILAKTVLVVFKREGSM